MVCPKCQNSVDKCDSFCNHCGIALNNKTKKEPSTTNVFGILSLIFANIPYISIAGIILGIIGIKKGTKCRKQNTTPLALSIVGTVNSLVTFIQVMSIVLYFVSYYLLYILMFVIFIFSTPLETTPYVEKFFI